MPLNTVSVCRPGRWGNPFVVSADMNAQQAVMAFEEALIAGKLPISFQEIRHALKGKHLACWCKEGSPCHADVLLKYANSDEDGYESAENFVGSTAEILISLR